MPMFGLGTAISVGGGLLSSLFGSNAAKKAAEVQANTAKYAADLQAQAEKDALQVQQQQFATQQANLKPFLETGQTAVTALGQQVFGGGFPDWTGKFTAPNDVTEQNDPGYQFRLAQGEKALENAAASRGTVLSGGHLKALSRYGQDYASNEYGNVYNRAFQQYLQGYNEFQNNQANKFNRFAALAGVGQTAATNLNAAAGQNASNVSNIMLGSANNIGNTLQQAAAARASGYVGSANAFGNAFANIGTNVNNAFLMNKLLSRPSSSATPNYPSTEDVLATYGGIH